MHPVHHPNLHRLPPELPQPQVRGVKLPAVMLVASSPSRVRPNGAIPAGHGRAWVLCVAEPKKNLDGYLLGTLWKRIIWSNSDNWWSMVDFEFPYLQLEDPEGSDGVCCFDSIFWTSFHGYPCITQGLNAVLSHSWINSVAIIMSKWIVRSKWAGQITI